MNKEMLIFSLLMLLLIVIVLLFTRSEQQQTGGWADPYAWIRPWTIVDGLRTSWLTR
jgi:hypothetical protein